MINRFRGPRKRPNNFNYLNRLERFPKPLSPRPQGAFEGTSHSDA